MRGPERLGVTQARLNATLGALIVALVAFGLTAVGVSVARFAEQRESEVERVITRAAAALTATVRADTAALTGVDAVVNGEGEADRFLPFAERVLENSALDVIGLVRRVELDQRRVVEQELGVEITEIAERGERGLVRAGERPDYWVLTAVVPLEPTTASVLGLDVASDPVRRRALERASERSLGMSRPFPAQPSGSPAVLAAMSIAGDDASPEWYVVTLVDGERILDEVVALLPSGTRLAVEVDDEPLATTMPGPGPGSSRDSVDVGGRTWTVIVELDGPGVVGVSLPIAVGLVTLVTVLGLGSRLLGQLRGQRREIDNVMVTVAVSGLARDLSAARTIDDIGRTLDRTDLERMGLRSLTLLDPTSVAPPEPTSVARSDATSDVTSARRRQGSSEHRRILPGGRVLSAVLADDPAGPRTRIEARVETIALLVEQVVERIRLAEAEHQLVEQIRHLFPEPARHEGLDVAVRQHAAAAELGFGGDWFDLIDHEDDCVSFVIGDVAGHGVDAAAEMIGTRATLRTLLAGDGELDEVLHQADRTLSTFPNVRLATATVGRLDLTARRLSIASAGHPPPILARPDGSVEVLDDARRSLLGFQVDDPVDPASRTIAAGTTLVLYSDGLIESRDRPIDSGIEQLTDHVATTPIDLDAAATADRLWSVMRAEAARSDQAAIDDDVTLIVIRILGD